MRILQRLRGLLSLSLLWGTAWVLLGLGVFFVVEGVIVGRPIRLAELPNIATRFAIVGALCGFSFGLLIAALERRRTFGGLTFRRMAIWGALAGCTFPTVLLSTTNITVGQTEMIVFGIFGSLGILTSVGTLALARRAPTLAGSASPESLGSGLNQ